MKNGMQVNMQFLADSLQKVCVKYIKHGEVRFNVNEDTGEEHINFEGIMKTALKNAIKKRYSEMSIQDLGDTPDDEGADYLVYVPIDDIRNFYYNLPWASIMLYYEDKKLYGIFIFDSLDETVIFSTTKETDKDVRIYRNMAVNNFRARRVSRGLYNISSVSNDLEIEVVLGVEPKKVISFFSPTLAMLSVIKGNMDGMAATIEDRRIIQAICLVYQKLNVSYVYKNDILSVL